MSNVVAFAGKEITKQTVTLENGTEVELRKLNLGLTLEATALVRDLIKELKQDNPELLKSLFDVESGTLNEGSINRLLADLPTLIFDILPPVFEKAVKLASLYTNTQEVEIKSDWTEVDLIEVLKPFFVHILAKLNGIGSQLQSGKA